MQYVGDFQIGQVLDSLNMAEDEEGEQRLEYLTKETWEYGGFLLMMDTVPEKSDYDYGSSYLRLITTYIPRIFWKDACFVIRKSSGNSTSRFARNVRRTSTAGEQ